MSKPKVIFLDAVGTLFGVKSSVGEIYSTIARRFGVLAPAQELDIAFYNVFKTMPPPTFPDVPVEQIPKKEFDWWRKLTQRTFQQVGVIHKFLDFDVFFNRLYKYFATSNPWELYSDVIPCLEQWQEQGIELGIISNFDTRLYEVLKHLNLKGFFSSITISSEVGAAKPDPEIFKIAISKHQVPPEKTWHIGDSYKDDYEGAKAIGMRGILLNRDHD